MFGSEAVITFLTENNRDQDFLKIKLTDMVTACCRMNNSKIFLRYGSIYNLSEVKYKSPSSLLALA